jgi:hypothetical protein
MRHEAASARVARVGTIDEHSSVSIVPVTFVIDGGTWYSPTGAGTRPARRPRSLPGGESFIVPPSATQSSYYRNLFTRELWRRAIRNSPQANRTILVTPLLHACTIDGTNKMLYAPVRIWGRRRRLALGSMSLGTESRLS